MALMADVRDVFVFSWPGCSDVSFDAQLLMKLCRSFAFFAASVSSYFSDCESLAFAVHDFIYAILNSFFCLCGRVSPLI